MKSDLKPDDMCTCGSRRLYRECHAPIFNAPRGKAIGIAQEIYAREWSVNADHYASQGLYSALAAELIAAGRVERVLDIGCGLGQGLEALASAISKKDRLIVGVDENPDCLSGSASRLGLPADAVASPRVRSKLGLRDYDAEPSATPIEVQGSTVLINADVVIADVAFERWLCRYGPFDAVTLWFTGGHKARALTKTAKRIAAQSDEDFRWAIEDKVMDIASRHLRPGGLIQLVTRASGDLEVQRQDTEANRRDGIAGFPVELVSVRSYPYAEPVASGAIQMLGAGGTLLAGQHMALSTLLRARDVSTEGATSGLFRVANRTPFNVAPERANALANKVFGVGDWSLNSYKSKASFSAAVADKSIHATWAGLGSLWCVAYVAFCAMQLGSMASRGKATKDSAAVDFGKQWHDLNLQAYVDYARRLVQKDENWPVGVNLPNAQASGESFEGSVNNLFFGALSWILLHEIGHVHHKHDALLPADQMVRQETQADDFATSWILEDAGSGLMREFRAMAIVTALAWLFLFESAGGQDPNHPPAILRFRAAVAKFDLGERSPAFENAYYLLKAMFDPSGPPPKKRLTPRRAFDIIAKRLEEIFPIR